MRVDTDLRVWGGLGDAIAALPIAYALREHGQVPSLTLVDNAQWGGTSMPPVGELGALPLLAEGSGGTIVNLQHDWQWGTPQAQLDRQLAKMGLQWGTTPRTALLRLARFVVDSTW